jgi:hypothetical protein
LCGAVAVTVPAFDGSVGACHCGMCRRWGGGPSLSIAGGRDLRIAGEEHIRCYESSERAERGFCAKCGTHLFYRDKATGARYVWAGLFDDLPGAAFDHQIYIDRKPAWYAFANETRNRTEAEMVSQSGANSAGA